MGCRPAARLRPRGGLGGGRRAPPAGAAQRSAAPPARPLRPPRGRGRVRPLDALDAAARRRARGQLARLARPAAGRARRALRALLPDEPARHRPVLPDVDQLRGDAHDAPGRRARRGVGAAPHAARLRPLRAGRDGDDREAGRIGPAREHHRRRTGGGGVVRADRAQVVLHASGVRGVLHARAGSRRDHLLRGRAPAPGLPPPAPQGQARRPLPGLRRGRVRPPARPHPRRGGPRHGVHDRADRLDPDRHDGRRRGNDAAAAERGGLAHAPAQRVRRDARIATRDGQRARRPRARGGGRGGRLRSGSCAPSTRATARSGAWHSR